MSENRSNQADAVSLSTLCVANQVCIFVSEGIGRGRCRLLKGGVNVAQRNHHKALRAER